MRRLLDWLLRLWRWLKMALLWLSSIGSRIISPPLAALWRVVQAVARWCVRVVEALLAAWQRIWRRNPERADTRRPQHLQACLALATLAMALIAYGTPLSTEIGWFAPLWRFLLLAVGAWLLAFLVLASWSTSDLEQWFVRALGRIRARTGLVRYERIGTVLALVLLWLPPVRPSTIPLRVALLITFVAFLADEYEPRQPRRATRIVPPPPVTEGGTTYSWDVPVGCDSERVEVTIAVAPDRYRSDRDANPGSQWQDGRPLFAEWVLRPTPEVDALAFELHRVCQQRRWSAFQELTLVTSFAQHFPYRTDLESRGVEEHWRFPLETLVDGEGDCEDLTILAAAVLRRMGRSVAVLYTDDHAALAVEAPIALLQGSHVVVDGRRYYYCELTAAGMRIGELPESVDPARLRVALLEPAREAVA